MSKLDRELRRKIERELSELDASIARAIENGDAVSASYDMRTKMVGLEILDSINDRYSKEKNAH